MQIAKRWQEECKKVDRGLYIDWSDEFKMFQVMHKDDRTGLTRRVMYVQDSTGKPCDLDMSLFRYIKANVDWERVGKNPDPDKLYQDLVNERELEKKKQELERKGYLFDYNREHRKEWKYAMNNFLQTMPKWQLDLMKKKYEHQKELNKKIIINYSRGNNL